MPFSTELSRARAESDETSPTVPAPPEVSLIDPSTYKKMPWKNGLGTTEEIHVEPPHVNFRTDPFVWRLSSASITSSCTWSQFPQCRTHIVLLPRLRYGSAQALMPPPLSLDNSTTRPMQQLQRQASTVTTTNSSVTEGALLRKPLLKMRHHPSSVTPISTPISTPTVPPTPTAAATAATTTTTHLVKPLIPYSYDGSWETSCEIAVPCQDLTLLVNKNQWTAEVSVENLDPDVAFQKLLFSTYTLLYVVSGDIEVSLESSIEMEKKVRAGQTLLIRRAADGGCSPIQLRAQAVSLPKREPPLGSPALGPAVGTVASAAASDEKETVVILFQIAERSLSTKEMAAETKKNSFHLSSSIPRDVALQPPPPVQAVDLAVAAATIQKGQGQQQEAKIPLFSSLEGEALPPLMNGVEQESQQAPRKHSVTMYDDQPLWALPQDLADKLNAVSLSSPKSEHPNPTSASRLPSFFPQQQWSSLDGWQSPSSPLLGGTKYPSLARLEPSQIYEPPEWSFAYLPDESEVPPPIVCDRLDLNAFPKGKLSTAWINMMKQGLSEWIRIPCLVARGVDEPDDLVLGITAALHGNEVNGVSCIQRVMADLDISQLKGTVVAVPCVNTPGYLNYKREFSDGKDLNRCFPGQANGTGSQVFAFNMMEKIVNEFNYLIDLHTASFGRVNSYYVRADLNDSVTATLARLQQPQIILHNSGQDGTMRSAAIQRGIKSITVEIGNPQQFQNQFIQWSYQGLMNILHHLGMYEQRQFMNNNGAVSPPALSEAVPPRAPTPFDPVVAKHRPYPLVICSKGFWTYTRTGGVLEVYPLVNTFVRKGLVVARIKNIFGNVVDEYYAPCDAMVIGRSSNPVAQAGDRIIHFGVPVRKGEALPAVAKENY